MRLPVVPPHCEQSYHMFYLVLPSLEARQGLIEHLKAHGILSVFHYVPLHLSPMGANSAGGPASVPPPNGSHDCLLRLPFYNDLSEAEQANVVDAVRRYEYRDAVGR